MPRHRRLALALGAIAALASASGGVAVGSAFVDPEAPPGQRTRVGRKLVSLAGSAVRDLRDGQEGERPTAQGVVTPEDLPISPGEARARAELLGLGTVQVAGSLLAGSVEPKWVQAVRSRFAPRENLRWPVDSGWFVRGFGSGEGGYHLAVDAAAPTGTPVRAAGAGLVAYSGNEVRGFGNMILLVHANGWVTLYAHNRRNRVPTGAFVRRGQEIGEVGNTGISRGPHVHFELMHRGRNCDPAPLFRPHVRHRDGDPSELTQADWRVGQGRPSEIACDRRRKHPRSGSFHEHPEETELPSSDAAGEGSGADAPRPSADRPERAPVRDVDAVAETEPPRRVPTEGARSSEAEPRSAHPDTAAQAAPSVSAGSSDEESPGPSVEEEEGPAASVEADRAIRSAAGDLG